MASIYLPRALEHIKQHMVLWYLNRTNGYVTKARQNRPITEQEYEDVRLTAEIDKVFALASQHVAEDAQKVFGQVVPKIQEMLQAMQQLTPKPQLPPEAQVLMETSMAETNRRAQRDQAELALETQKMTLGAEEKARREQIDVALNAADNLTKERIETARLTQKDAELQAEQFDTAISLQNEAQRRLLGGL
jgi:phosphate starvation-inducible protein PhoH